MMRRRVSAEQAQDHLMWPERRIGDQSDADRRTSALMGFIVILVLAIAGVVLIRELAKNAKLEDCLMSGRRNCAPIEVPLRGPN